MKKIIALLCATAMLGTFTACGKDGFGGDLGKVEKIGEVQKDGSHIDEDGNTVLADGSVVTDSDEDSDKNTDKDEDNSEPDKSDIKKADIKEAEKGSKVSVAKPAGPQRCVAYFTSWSAYARAIEVSNMDPNLLTHVNFAFANLHEDGEIVIGDSWVDVEKPFGNDNWEGAADSRGHFNQLKLMKQKYPHVKTLISVGGWTWSGNFSKVAASESARQKFAESALTFCTKYGFDGLDIDWEFPVEGGNDIAHLPEDKENYTKLLKKCREVFDAQGKKDGKHYLLTIAGGPNPTFVKNTETKKMMDYLDFINVMSYDYHGGWENKTGHNAPLYATDPADPLCVSDTIQKYIDAGVKPADLNMGLAYYGRGWINVSSQDNNGYLQAAQTAPQTSTGFGIGTWEGACFDYWDLTDNYLGKGGYKRYFDSEAKVPYLFNGTNFISYDDEESIRYKLDFANKKKLGGVMFWEFSGDKHMELQKIVADCQGIKATTAAGIPATSSKNEETPTTTAKSDSPAPSTSGNTWNKDTVYNQGDTVTYNGHTFQANWWTQGDTPDANNEWGAWKLIS